MMPLGGDPYGEAYYSTTYRDYVRQNPFKKLDFYRSTVERHARKDGPLRVLDVGCGLGSFLAHLRKSDPYRTRFSLTGIDVSEFAVAANTATYPAETFHVSGAEQIAGLGQAFDVVTAFDVLEHLEDPDQAASAISRSLAQGGVFHFVVPVYDGILGPIVRFLDKDETHVQLQSREWWLDWAASHFEVIEWVGIFRMLTPWNHYFHFPTRLLRNIAPAILITGTL
jgi:SAM-dependent methyltransferase